MSDEKPRVRRTYDFELVRTQEGTDGLTLEGYAAVFNEWTEINSWEGHFLERVAPGAFKRSLSMRTPVMQFDHGTHPLIGSIPIGIPTVIREDAKGLFLRGRLHDNWLIEPVRDAIRDGSITGMSFRFAVNRDKWERPKGETPKRTLVEVSCSECGPVVFPAYAGTAVGVRSEIRSMLADPEERQALARFLAFGQEEDVVADDQDERRELSIKFALDGRDLAAEFSRTFDAAFAEGTSEEQSDTPPELEAPVGAHRKRIEQTLRRLSHSFPEIAKEQS